MALRIIRKSASQNQVEIVKGTRDETPLLSLLFFIETEAERDALAAFLNTQTWVQDHAQCVIMKSHTLKESLRSHFSALQHTLKLLNEPKQQTWPARLQALLSEAETTWCVFSPQFTPEIDLNELCQAYLKAMPQHPNTALLAPVLQHHEKVFAAGQMLGSKNIAPHTLSIGPETLEIEPHKGLHFFYQGLSQTAFARLTQGNPQTRFLSEAVPLPFCAMQRDALLEALSLLDETSHTWDFPWLSQALAQHLGALQYRVGLIPHALPLEEHHLSLFTTSATPEHFPTPYQGTEQTTCFTLYTSHGLQQKGTRFTHIESKG